MKKLSLILLFLVSLAWTGCHKDNETNAKDPVISKEEMTISGTQVCFEWHVDFLGQFQTGVELSRNENMSDLRRVEATKHDEKYVAIVDGLSMGTRYYYRIVVWNKFNNYGQQVKDFTTIQECSVILSCNPEEGGAALGDGIFVVGDTCTVVAIANAGYNFVNWTENENQISADVEYKFTVINDRNLVAHFTSQEFTITATAEPEEGGTVDGSGGYNTNDECTLRATANEGYTFVNWTKDGTEVSTNPVFTFTVTETATYVAHFQIQSYTINVAGNPENGGTVEGGGTYEYGQNCTVRATEANGYHFVNWTENGEQVSSDEEYTFTVTSDRDLVANFQVQLQDYTISVSANPTNGGSVTGGGTYQQGQSCTVSAMANSGGYTFTNWTENGDVVSTDVNYTFTVTGNRILVANFTQQFTVTVTADPTNGGTVTGGGTYTYGQLCTLTATPANGYNFVYWTMNGGVVANNNPFSFTVNDNRNLVANFTPQSQAPQGAINGQFTINENGDKVYFSKGNLQYIGSATTPYWKFADNQWDCLGNNGQGSDSQTVDRDLFGWGTSGYHDSSDPYNVNYQPWAISADEINATYNKYGYGPSTNKPSPNLTGSSANYDWGVYNQISNGSNTTNTWRTLTGGSNGEWKYVFDIRSASTVNGVANARYAKAKVANMSGVILFPDVYLHPTEVALPVSINQTDNTGWNGNDYSAADFLLMQDAGAVFLPAAGYRYGTSVSEVGSYGYFWSASFHSSGYAYDVYFSSGYLFPSHYNDRHVGRSVRLVAPAE